MSSTFTATAEASNVPPRVRLNVTISGGSGVSVMITRTTPGGTTEGVRLADPGAMAGTAWVGYDYESAYGVPSTYTAVVTYTNPGTIVDTKTDIETLPVTGVWLIHPGIPDLSVPLPGFQRPGPRARAVDQGVFAPFGRSDPIVVTDGRRKAVQTQLAVATTTLDELDALVAITDDTSPLLLNVPASLGWGVTNEYISLGELVESPVVNLAEDPHRLITAPYLVVGRPVGGSQSQRTYQDLLAEAATYQGLLDLYPTYLALRAPTSDLGVPSTPPPSGGLYEITGLTENPPGSGLYNIT